MPAVSVIMPAYNVAAYVGDAVESVRAQTFTDLELLVVDDGSTDDTAAVVRRLAARDARVRLSSRPNGGISAARNTALRLSSGAVLAILDGDDTWCAGFLQAQMDVLERHPGVDVVTGNAYFLGGRLDGRPARPFPNPAPPPGLAEILQDEESVFIMSIFRRRVYEAIGGFDETLRTNEDYDYWIRAASAGFRFARNDTPLAHYRRRHDSLSANELAMLRGILRVYEKARPALARRPEHAILNRQVRRFQAELVAAEARDAIEKGNFPVAAERLATLQRQRGGAAMGLARLAARWAPALLSRAYSARRRRLHAADGNR